jgi:hypothetical protein
VPSACPSDIDAAGPVGGPWSGGQCGDGRAGRQINSTTAPECARRAKTHSSRPSVRAAFGTGRCVCLHASVAHAGRCAGSGPIDGGPIPHAHRVL